MYLQEVESTKERDKKHREDTFGRMNAMSLNEYVMNSRNSLHAGRAKEKRDKIIARLKLEEEMKVELKKARMKAYEDLLEEEATKGQHTLSLTHPRTHTLIHAHSLSLTHALVYTL